MNDQEFKTLKIEIQGEIALVGLNRPEKRNAINDALIDDIYRYFQSPPKEAKVIVLHGIGDHFSAGLDLAEIVHRTPFESMHHSQSWHRAFNAVQFNGLPVVAALKGGVVGGGLELAAAAHVRVADASSFYALPEGIRGIFVGGGASVRVARLLGEARMTDMMLTGRSYNAEEGYAIGASQYLVDKGQSLDKAIELAQKIAKNAPQSNYAILNAIPRISNMSTQDGLFTESLMAALAASGDDSKERIKAFFEKRAPKAGAC